MNHLNKLIDLKYQQPPHIENQNLDKIKVDKFVSSYWAWDILFDKVCSIDNDKEKKESKHEDLWRTHSDVNNM